MPQGQQGGVVFPPMFQDLSAKKGRESPQGWRELPGS